MIPMSVHLPALAVNAFAMAVVVAVVILDRAHQPSEAMLAQLLEREHARR